jgi:uncharacterized protein
MKRYLAAILAGVAIVIAACATDPYQKGFKAYRSGDYGMALQELTPLAEQGDAEAQLHLGLLYRDGLGVMPDHKEAEKWLRKSAEQENINARIALGMLYADRQGLVQNDVLALLWFNFAIAQGSQEAEMLREELLIRMTPAQIMEAQRLGRGYKTEREFIDMARELRPKASAGDASAQLKLGTLYYRGQGMSRDYAEAARLFIMAAQQGNPYAQANLGYMFELGEGVPQDYGQAVKWYLKSAEQGNKQAQFSLGRLFEKGQGVPQSDVVALMFYTLAASGGESRAIADRDRLTVWLPPDQVAEAQRRAGDFKILVK